MKIILWSSLCDLLNETDLPVQLSVIFKYTNWDPHSWISRLLLLAFTYMYVCMFTFGIEIMKSTQHTHFVYVSLFVAVVVGWEKSQKVEINWPPLFPIISVSQTIRQVYQTWKLPFGRRGYDLKEIGNFP